MPLAFDCPNCGKRYDHIKREFLGKRIQCHCGCVLRLGPKHHEGSDEFDLHLAIHDSDGSMGGTVMSDDEDSDDSFNSIQATKIISDTSRHPKSEKHRPREKADDQWNTKNIEFDLKEEEARKKKQNHRYDGLPALENDRKRDHAPPGYTEELHKHLAALPAPEFLASQLPPMPPAPPPPMVYRNPTWAQGGAIRKRSEAKPAIVAFITAIGLFQCLVMIILAIAVVASCSSTYSTWAEKGFESTLYTQLQLRIVLGVVLLLATVGFGIFLMLSLFSANEEISEHGAVSRTTASINVASAAAVYMLMLFAIAGVTVFTMDDPNAKLAAESLEGIWWPKTVAEVLSTTLISAVIPLMVFFVGVFRVLDD
ncbi:MAG: hypothetical protein ABL888_05420 [Pirellulaceae bacterium]